METGNEGGVQSTGLNYDYYTKNMESELDFLKPFDKQKLKKKLVPPKSKDMMQKLELNFNHNLSEGEKIEFNLPNPHINMEEYEEDFSELFKNFNIDYDQKMSLDDKRARMFIINKLQAATN